MVIGTNRMIVSFHEIHSRMKNAVVKVITMRIIDVEASERKFSNWFTSADSTAMMSPVWRSSK